MLHRVQRGLPWRWCRLALCGCAPACSEPSSGRFGPSRSSHFLVGSVVRDRQYLAHCFVRDMLGLTRDAETQGMPTHTGSEYSLKGTEMTLTPPVGCLVLLRSP